MSTFKSDRANGSGLADSKEMVLTYKKAAGTAKPPAPMQATQPQRRHPSSTTRDAREAQRGVIEIEERQPADTSILQARAMASAAQRPPITARPTKKRIITPQMVKRRNINAKNPLVMKSDESTSGKESAMTEMTEKCSNKKDAKRKNRAYASFGNRQEVKVGGKEKLPPPLPLKSPTRPRTPNENDGRASNKIEIRGLNKLKTISPTEYEEDALLLKRLPSGSGQSCSAFFLGDGSTASGISGKKSVTSSPPRKTKTLNGKDSRSVESRQGEKVETKARMEDQARVNGTKTAENESKKSHVPTDTGKMIETKATDGNETRINGAETAEPIESLDENEETDGEDQIKSSPSSLSALKSQLLAFSKKKSGSKSSQGSEGDGEEDVDCAMSSKEPSKTMHTEVDLQKGDVSERGERAREVVGTIEAEQAKLNNGSTGVDTRAESGDACDKSKEGVNPIVETGEPTSIKNDEHSVSKASNEVVTPNEDKSMVSEVKKRRMTMTSFLGKQSKVIDEDAEYVEKDLKDEDRYAGIHDQASDEIMDIHLQATLSECEFSSVQSSVTTDKIFEAQPSLIQRTGSLIRNPLLRRNRSKKRNEMDEVIQCMKKGKLAAKTDNNKVEEFDDKPTNRRNKRTQLTRQRIRSIEKGRTRRSEVDFDDQSPSLSSEQSDSEDVEEMYDVAGHLSSKKTRPANRRNKRTQITRQRSRSIEKGGMRSEVSDFDDQSPLSTEQPDSEDAEEMYDFDSSVGHLSNKKTRSAMAPASTHFEDDSSDGQNLLAKKTFDDSLTKRHGRLPTVDTSAKIDVKSPSFRLSAVSGAGTGLNSPLAQQALINALNARAQSHPKLQNPSTDHGTETTAESQAGIRMVTSDTPAARSSSGTFGDVIETIGLFSARLCLGTGAALVSCSRACNENPKSDMRQVGLGSSSFIEPDVGVFASPRYARVSPRMSSLPSLSPTNGIFRDEPTSAVSASNSYSQAIASAISKMPEQDQLDLVQQLSSGSFLLSPRSTDMNDMASSVDGMFRQRGSGMKRVPHNIAAKPKSHMTAENVAFGRQKTNPQPEAKPAKTPMGRFKKGIKRLAKTRLAVMYQV